MVRCRIASVGAPVILVAGGAQITLASVLVIPGISTTIAVAVLISYGFAQPARGAAQMALIADVVPPERRPHAFGTFRVTFNAAALVGPLLAAVLVSLSWTLVHLGVVTLLTPLPAERDEAAVAEGRWRPVRNAVGSDVSSSRRRSQRCSSPASSRR